MSEPPPPEQAFPKRQLLEALEHLRDRVQRRNSRARIVIHDYWWKKTRNLGATFTGDTSGHGAEVVFSVGVAGGLFGELLIERILTAEFPPAALGGAALPAPLVAALDVSLGRCEGAIVAYLGS